MCIFYINFHSKLSDCSLEDTGEGANFATVCALSRSLRSDGERGSARLKENGI